MTFIGVVKSANQQQGYGFIDCKETHAVYSRDVFLHKSLLGVDKFMALRKGEVIKFAVQMDQKGHPQAATVTNDRLERAEAEGRLKDLATEQYTPPWPPNLNIGVTRTYADMQAAAMASMKPQLMVLPDGQIVYIVPQQVPTMKKEDDGNWNTATMFGDDRSGKKFAANIQTMQDSKHNRFRKEYTPNPGLDPNLPAYRGVVKQVPDDDTGYGFVSSPEMQQKFGRDAFLHNKNCPWLHFTDLERNENILFQVELNDRQQPSVVRFVKYDSKCG